MAASTEFPSIAGLFAHRMTEKVRRLAWQARRAASQRRRMGVEARRAVSEGHRMTPQLHRIAMEGNNLPASRPKLRFFRLLTLSDEMKMQQAPLLVGLDGKMARVSGHWAVVDEALPPQCPLLLLSGVDGEGFERRRLEFPALRKRVIAQEQAVKLVRASYEKRKGDVHGWVVDINRWVRVLLKGTEWASLARPVPVRGRSYGKWHRAASDALGSWRMMEVDPPDVVVNWPMNFRPDCTVEKFAEVVRAFGVSHLKLSKAELHLKMARGALRRAQEQAAALLMAYGHGVRARLGQKGALVRSIPKLWPG